MKKRRLAILGSTGSIGTQALEVAALHPDRFEVAALTAHSRYDKLFEQVRAFHPRLAGLVQPIPREEIPADLRFCEWVFGPEALTLAAQADVDDVLISVVGMVGLKSVLTALEGGRRVLLANKEALVAGGHLVMEAARRVGEHALLPVDSEHSAIFQCLQGAGANPYSRIILTCSGGPFRTWSKDDIRAAAKEQALKHPNWVMGQKITIDSATLFNKALEMIEAKWLFDARPDQIEVVVHPQSVIHSGVEFADGALIAQLGTPDMRLPIRYAMTYPNRGENPAEPLDLLACPPLTFAAPDREAFPCLRLAEEAASQGGTACAILNGANEEAVRLFLADRIGFHDIPRLVEKARGEVPVVQNPALEEILAADRAARRAVLGK